MSDALVLGLVEELEGILADPAWVPDPDFLLGWNQRFAEAAARAERGPEWPEILKRAHALGDRVPSVVDRLAKEMDAIRHELAGQERGQRALKGYGASAR
ncbi:hypothetical protein [Geothrix sp.]|jgi:hypothetical protein|uniref:hypothetical protein n=1 Tax=Geothrix sp. TaxID=1962974 RepID=UPI0025B9C60B|nr:hypothetical protein [Geothrix sp.]